MCVLCRMEVADYMPSPGSHLVEEVLSPANLDISAAPPNVSAGRNI